MLRRVRRREVAWEGINFFSFEGGFESFFDESLSDVGDGIGVAMKLFGDFAVGGLSVCCFIDGE